MSFVYTENLEIPVIDEWEKTVRMRLCQDQKMASGFKTLKMEMPWH